MREEIARRRREAKEARASKPGPAQEDALPFIPVLTTDQEKSQVEAQSPQSNGSDSCVSAPAVAAKGAESTNKSAKRWPFSSPVPNSSQAAGGSPPRKSLGARGRPLIRGQGEVSEDQASPHGDSHVVISDDDATCRSGGSTNSQAAYSSTRSEEQAPIVAGAIGPIDSGVGADEKSGGGLPAESQRQPREGNSMVRSTLTQEPVSSHHHVSIDLEGRDRQPHRVGERGTAPPSTRLATSVGQHGGRGAVSTTADPAYKDWTAVNQFKDQRSEAANRGPQQSKLDAIKNQYRQFAVQRAAAQRNKCVEMIGDEEVFEWIYKLLGESRRTSYEALQQQLAFCEKELSLSSSCLDEVLQLLENEAGVY